MYSLTRVRRSMTEGTVARRDLQKPPDCKLWAISLLPSWLPPSPVLPYPSHSRPECSRFCCWDQPVASTKPSFVLCSFFPSHFCDTAPKWQWSLPSISLPRWTLKVAEGSSPPSPTRLHNPFLMITPPCLGRWGGSSSFPAFFALWFFGLCFVACFPCLILA